SATSTMPSRRRARRRLSTCVASARRMEYGAPLHQYCTSRSPLGEGSGARGANLAKLGGSLKPKRLTPREITSTLRQNSLITRVVRNSQAFSSNRVITRLLRHLRQEPSDP